MAPPKQMRRGIRRGAMPRGDNSIGLDPRGRCKMPAYMRRKREKTLPVTRERIFLIVGRNSSQPSQLHEQQVLEQHCLEIGRAIGGVPNPTPLASLHTRAARWRPFAIVMPHDVYVGDPTEYELLARDVGAQMVPVAVGLSSAELKHRLAVALNATMMQEG